MSHTPITSKSGHVVTRLNRHFVIFYRSHCSLCSLYSAFRIFIKQIIIQLIRIKKPYRIKLRYGSLNVHIFRSFDSLIFRYVQSRMFTRSIFMSELKASRDPVAAPNERAGADTSRTNRGIHMLKCGLIFATSRSKNIHNSATVLLWPVSCFVPFSTNC